MSHSPNANPSTLYNCAVCPESDAYDNMVACDVCDKWYHYACAKVNENIKTCDTWVCRPCQSKTQPPSSFPQNTNPSHIPLPQRPPMYPTTGKTDNTKPASAHSSSKSGAKPIKDHLPRKSAPKASSKKSTHKQADLLVKKLEEELKLREQREQDYIKRKYEILEQVASDDDEYSESDGSVQDIRIEDWVNKSVPLCTKVRCRETSNVIQPKFTLPHSSVKDPEIPPDFSPISKLTKSQIAARQIMSKEYVKFSGRPEEWPLFISWYENSSKMCAYSSYENLHRLQRCLTGQALDRVRLQLLHPDQVPNVISTLHMLYGRPEIIIKTILDKIRSEQPPKPDKLHTIIDFAISVANVCATIKSSGLNSHLNNPCLLQELVDRLPTQMRLDWGIYKHRLPPDSTNLDIFSNWLSQIANAAAEVTITTHITTSDRSQNKANKKPRGFVNIHEKEESSVPRRGERRCSACDRDCQSLPLCQLFLGMTVQERWAVIKRNFLCRTCLRYHGRQRCPSKQTCGINGCAFRHHRMLHKSEQTTSRAASEDSNNNSAINSHLSCTTNRQGKGSLLFKILPVYLYSRGKKLETYAFLDDGSSVTLIDEELAQLLNVEGKVEPLCLKWTGNTHRNEEDSRLINLEASAPGDSKRFPLMNVHTVKSLELPIQSINAIKLLAKYKHLKNVPLKSYENARPRLLIGLQHWRLGIPLKAIEGAEDQPVAIKTRLGWTVFGPLDGGTTSITKGGHHYHICECQRNPNESMYNLMKSFFSIDTAGITSIRKPISTIEERARQLLEEKTIFDGERYAVPLLWKYNEITLPKSRQMAEKRLLCLERKLSRDPEMFAKVNEQIRDYIGKNYAAKLSSAEASDRSRRIWYLPIFPVRNPNKPNKIRMVWDAAAKVEGVSLNSVLLTGPDEVPPLIAVLFRFRERRITLVADIREMFHQVRILEEDQDAERFLWRNENTGEIEEFKMKVMTFGATCSPYCAQYIKNENAKRFATRYPRAAEAVINNHYVDDYLDSVDYEEEAIKLAKDVIYIHKQGGFEIRNFLSNSSKVLDALEERSSSVNKCLIGLNIGDSEEKLLGMWWSPKVDRFAFKLKQAKVKQDIMAGNTIPTKREVLKVLMSVFDPLGLVAHFTIILKLLIQDIWRSSIEWDQQISDSHFEIWKKWLGLIPIVRKMSIQRPYLSQLTFTASTSVQLHIFVDAGESAFAAVAYLRASSETHTECALVGAKTRVGPLISMSIPRMELEAAVLGVRFSNTILKNHSITINKTHFWTDSRIVLCWITSPHRKYKQFVAHRIGEILEGSNEKDWKWVPTEDNVADDATKQKNWDDFRPNSRWFNGPDFLHQPESEWPKTYSETCQQPAVDHEVKICYTIQTSIKITPLIDYQRFSQWNRLLRTILFVFRFIQIKCKKRRVKNTELFSETERFQAECYLYRLCQREGFEEEYRLLCKGGTELNKSSPLYKLSPYMDENLVIRVRGRIDAAPNVDHQVRRPVILPKSHYITNLIVQHFHVRFYHANNETIINEMRQIYYVPHLRAVLKKCQRSCRYCERKRVVPKPPMMGQLPAARLMSYTRPFSYVGVDYFGPLYVKVGRHKEKRWGMLITCLTVRAIHIEITHSLTSDSCILGIKRFASRRGMPREIFSDNGTNFRGASEELKRAIKGLNTAAMAKGFEMQLKWNFIPPQSPHMGGSWERLVRSVKTTLAEISLTNNPSDELLLSMMAEVEIVVNSRPLTYVPIEVDGQEALTPNHFLLGSSNGLKIAGDIFCDGASMKKNWLLSEKYANSFWRRWVREYLPNLTRRSKWFGPSRAIKEGDIVIIIDAINPRGSWPMGKVIKAIEGRDGTVRSAVVQTSTGIYTRPAVKLAVLDIHQSDKGEMGRVVDLAHRGECYEGGSTRTDGSIGVDGQWQHRSRWAMAASQ